MERTVILGLDVGQRRDPTALAVVEAAEERTGRTIHLDHEPPWGRCERCYPETEDVFAVRDIGRLRTGTRYPVVADRVAEAVVSLNDAGTTPYMLMDVTGVGRPVFDIIAGSLLDAEVYLSAVTFTGGTKLRGHLGSHDISMPKPLLVSRLQALLQTRRVRMPDNEQTRALAEELRTYEVHVSEDARLTAGAFSVGAHDDMATALGLACLFDPSREQVTYSRPPWL